MPRQVCSAHQPPVQSRTTVWIVPVIARSSPYESRNIGSSGRLTSSS
jgi:hypothetical protein